MTVAQLGIAVDSSQAAKGAVNLDALATSATRAEQATNELAPATDKAAAAHAKFSTQSMAASHAARGMIEQLALGVSPVQALTAQMSHLSFAAAGEGGLLGALKGVGAAFAPMLSLPNLITFGVIGLAAAIPSIYEAFTGAGAQSAEEALKRQKSLIDDIAKSWPEAAAGLKDYLDQAGRRTQNEAIVATREQIAAATKELASLSAQFDNLLSNRGGGRSGPSNPLAFQPELLATITETVHQFEQGAITASALKDRIAKIELDPKLSETTRTLLRNFADLADKIGLADATAHAFSSTLEKLSSFDIVGSDFSVLAGVGNSVVDQLRQMAPDLRTPKQKATDTYKENSALDFDGSIKKQLDYTLAQIDAQKAMQDAAVAQRQAEAAAKAHEQAVKSVTASLSDQLAALTETDREQFISTELSRAKADAATDEGKKIAELAGTLYDQKHAAADLKATLDDLNQTGMSLTEGFFSTLKGDLKEGKSLWESFGDAASGVLDSLADKALKMAADGIWNSIFGAITGGITGGNVAAGLGRSVAPSTFDFASFLNGHAAGTSSAPPGMAWVGEGGPELMTFKGGEHVYSNAQSRAMAANGNSANQNAPITPINVTIHNNSSEQVRTQSDGQGGLEVIIGEMDRRMTEGTAGKGFAKRYGLQAGVRRR